MNMQPKAIDGRRRIFYILNRLRIGGLENVALELANALNPDRFECTIVSFARPDPLQEKRLRPHVRLVALDKKQGNDLSVFYRLYRLFRDARPHIIQTHNWGTLLEGVSSGKVAGVPIIIHAEHGTVEERKRNIVIQRWVWKHIDQVLGVSEAHRMKLAQVIGFPLNKIKIIGNGIDLNRFSVQGDKARIRGQLGLPLEGCYIGAVGGLRPVKDHALLLRAMAKLMGRSEALRLVVSGGGPLADTLQSQALSLGIQGRTHFLGARDDIHNILNTLDIFVLPSKSEAMPLSLLEAMACGLPVVASAVGGIPEMVENGQTGMLVPPKDETALVAALERLIANEKERTAMGIAARQAVEKRYGLEAMVKEYEALYDLLSGEKAA